MEVRRKDGQPYPPNTLHQLCCGVLRCVRKVKPEIGIFKDPEFLSFRKTLDAEMKRLKGTPGVRSVPKQAEPISAVEKEILWSKGLLGSHNPRVLVDTMVFMAGVYFALRSGEEHRQLRFSSVQLIEKPKAFPYLLYTESVSKNNPGGLKHRKVTTKQVTHHANTDRPDRCFVELYKQYRSHRPENVKDDAFYLTPIRNATGIVWYRRQAIGVNTLAATVKRLCEKAGIIGYKTNHSLCVTAATRLFRSGMDEQLIMERTGHRSTDGVRAYKRSSLEQQALVSRVLNGQTDTQSLSPPLGGEGKENTPRAAATDQQSSAIARPVALCSQRSPIATPTADQQNSAITGPVAQRSPAPTPPTPVSFTGCSGITINYNFGK